MKPSRHICAAVAFLPSVVSAAWAGDGPRSLALDQALRELDEQSPTLAQARSRVVEARALAKQATVPLLPTVVAAGGYTRNSDERIIDFSNTPLAAVAPGALVLQPLGVWTVSGSVRVPLVVPNAWADWSAAQGATDAMAATAESARLQLRASLALAAWATAAAEEIVAATERAITVAEEHRRSAARGVTAGTEAPLAVIKADTEVVKRQSDLAQARANQGRGYLALGVLLGKAEPVRVLLPPNKRSEAQEAALMEEALANRPEMTVQAAQIRSAQAQVRSAKLRWLPQLSGSGTIFAADVPYPTGKKNGWRLTLDLLWPVYDGGLRSGKRDQADAALSTARAAADAQRLGILQEVQDARRDIAVAEERLRLAEQQRDFATAAAASAKRIFEAGVANSLEVLDANDKLYLADVALADAHARLGMAVVTQDKALGRMR